MRPLLALSIVLPALLSTAPTVAQSGTDSFAQGSDAQRYSECLSLASSAPEDAFEAALAWQQDGGGDAARHCAAVALLGQGLYRDAAERLETLAQTMLSPAPGLLADVLAQAGQAWLLADDTQRAFAAQSAAIELAPKNIELLIDRSFALAQAQNYWEAIDDLNRAAELAPDRPDILVYRASAYRYVDAFDLALTDVNAALRIAPDDLEGLLERGILRRLSGDDAGAREDWLKVVTLAEDSPAAEAARSNLERLDVNAD